MSTPQARAVIGSAINGASNRAAPIRARFNSTGVNAGTPNRP